MTRANSYSISCLSPKRWRLRGLCLMFGFLMLGGCKASQPESPVVVAQDAAGVSTKSEETSM